MESKWGNAGLFQAKRDSPAPQPLFKIKEIDCMDIAQLNVTYDPLQDRVLLRVGSSDGTEIRLWLTRRLLLGLRPMWQRAVEHARSLVLPAGATHDARNALIELERESVRTVGDFKSPFKAAAAPTQLPLGELPLLVSEVRLTPQPSGNLKSEWEENGKAVTMELAPAMMHALSELIDQAVLQAEWGVTLPAPEPVAASADVVRH
jgi:hypothetical protein